MYAQVDFKIVEVALFFMHEVLKGGAQSDDQVLDGASPHLPVMLLSNDNAQIAAARAHGLPSFRLSSPGSLAKELEVMHSPRT